MRGNRFRVSPTALRFISPSSPRTRGPIRRGLRFERRCSTAFAPPLPAVVMGPRVRGDDMWRFNCQTAAATASRSRRAFRASFATNFPPSPTKRAQGMPGARCTRGLVRNVHKRNAHEHTGSAEAIRHSPRNGFNGLLRALPGDRAFLSPSSAGLCPANLTPASRRQDHTTSPSASRAIVFGAIRVHRIPLRVRDVAQRPSEWDGMRRDIAVIWVSEKQKYFS